MSPSASPGPAICVWEVTLECNARCLHCGSTAGVARQAELDTEEALDLVRQLAGLGCRSVTLSGGEPLLRRDWPELAHAIRASGMRLEMVTNGLLVAAQADAVARAGFFAVTASVDGPEEVHDALRGIDGALEQTLAGARALVERGVRVGAVTQVGRRNADRLEETFDLLVDAGFSGWQVQLTLPLGRARGQREDLCLPAETLPSLEKSLASLVLRRPGFFVQAADSIGYMGRKEPLIRTGGGEATRVWGGCQAGLRVVGITSDGRVRGCLSMPPSFDEGSLRQRSLREIWQDPERFAYNRGPEAMRVTGACEGCPLASRCRAGCTSLAYATTGTTTETALCLRRLADGDGGAR